MKDGAILSVKSSIFAIVSNPAKAVCEVQELIPTLRSVVSTTIADLIGSLRESEFIHKVSELEDEALTVFLKHHCKIEFFQMIDFLTELWGVKIFRIKIDIIPGSRSFIEEIQAPAPIRITGAGDGPMLVTDL